MRSRILSPALLGAIVLVVCGAAPVRAAASGHVERQTGTLADGSVGARYEVLAPGFPGTPPAPVAPRLAEGRRDASRGLSPGSILSVMDTVYTDRVHLTSMPEVVSISGSGRDVMVGWWLNVPRASHYAVFGPGAGRTPTWSQALNSLEVVPVDNADRDSVCVTSGSLDSLYSIGTAGTLRFDIKPAPFYEQRLTATCDSAFVVVATEARDDTTRIIGRDPVSGATLWTRTLFLRVNGIDVSSNGSVVAATTDAGVFTWNGQTGAPTDTVLITGGSPWPPAVSWNGNLLVVGGYSSLVRVYQWNSGSSQYVPKWQYDTGATYVTAVDVSDDGSTILAGTLVATTQPTGTLCMFDSSSAAPLWVETSFGDLVSDVSLSGRGSVGAATSWGRRTSTVGKVFALFHRASFDTVSSIRDDEVFSVGSFLSVEMSDNGFYCVAGARIGHARTLGNGGSIWVFRGPGEPTSIEAGPGVVSPQPRYALFNARPNPSRPYATLEFRMPDEGGEADLAIFDVTGRRVRGLVAGTFSGGRHETTWDGRDDAGREAPSGLYFYRLSGEGFAETRKLVLER